MKICDSTVYGELVAVRGSRGDRSPSSAIVIALIPRPSEGEPLILRLSHSGVGLLAGAVRRSDSRDIVRALDMTLNTPTPGKIRQIRQFAAPKEYQGLHDDCDCTLYGGGPGLYAVSRRPVAELAIAIALIPSPNEGTHL